MVDPVTVVTGAVAGLKLANSAFEQVKNLLESGRSVADAGAALSKYFTGVAAVEKEANSVGPGSDNSTSRAIEVLAARQKIREQRQFLREFLQLKGPSGAWEEFLQIEREFRLANKKQKEDQEKARRAKVAKLKNIAAAALIVFGILLVIGIGVVVYLNISDAEALNVTEETPREIQLF